MKKVLTNLAFSSIVAAALGIVLMVWPTLSNQILCWGIAAALFAYGIYRIISYFVRDNVASMLERDLALGLLAIAVGVFVVVKPDVIVSILPVIFGLCLIAGAMSSVQTAFDMKRMETEHWAFSLIAALAFLALGIVILINPFGTAVVLTRFIGISLTVEGIVSFIFSVAAAKRRSVYYPSEKEQADSKVTVEVQSQGSSDSKQ